MMHSEKHYQAESDVRTLIEAGEIKKDKTRYKATMAMAKKQQEALKYITMNPGEMGKMSYPAYSKARKSRSMNGQTSHYT